MSELAADNPQFNYRQVGIVNAENTIAVHTGSNKRSWAGHLTGEGYIVMGNVLAGEEVLKAMAETFEKQEQADLDERLLCSVEAGRDAGGQAGRAVAGGRRTVG